MFEATRLTFYYTVTPVHMGAGSAIGAIDNPIQREVHTQYPVFAGSGLKGALRHHFNRVWPGEKEKKNEGLIGRIFGPETNASEFAGALSLSDAQLVALPVRSLKRAFVYATCPLALARVKRLAELAKVPVSWDVPDVPTERALVVHDDVLAQGRLILEAFEFQKADGDIQGIATWLADNALPNNEANKHFGAKLKTDLVVLADTEFAHFARHAMVVEPHVRIDDDSGTADDGGLYYTENLPPETLLVGLTQASVERFKKGEKDKVPDRYDDADKVLDAVFDGPGNGKKGIKDRLLQIGGDATVGRGLVLVHPVKKGG
ncbi:MAG: type III-B CRISPR module RAMP protein Cmr4 [Betaproteobacteria bacterium]|nr:type III-B CRISPR module RAMP protein Cmr4 [Betaproteobacteria bacterium]